MAIEAIGHVVDGDVVKTKDVVLDGLEVVYLEQGLGLFIVDLSIAVERLAFLPDEFDSERFPISSYQGGVSLCVTRILSSMIFRGLGWMKVHIGPRPFATGILVAAALCFLI